MKRQLVDHLVESDIVSRKDVQRCVLRASMNESSVVDELTDRLDVDQHSLAAAMAAFWGFECSQGSSLDVAESHRDVISAEQARDFGVVPVGGNDDHFQLAVYDVEKARPVIDEIRRESGFSPSVVIAPREVVEQEVQNHYLNRPAGVGVVSKRPRRSRRGGGQGVISKKRSTVESSEDSPETRLVPVEEYEEQAKEPADDAQPTRQVDLSTDNPFMDLVEKTADESSVAEIEKEQAKQQSAPVEDEEEPDFFDDFPDEAFEEIDEESWSESDVEVARVDDVEAALDEFDAELAADESEAEAAVLSSSASVNWGDYSDGSERLPGDPDAHQSGSHSGASGIFPVDRDHSGFLGLPDDGEAEEMTLAEIVERQGRAIDKLEREVEYQKGIMQNMAELLVEARVLSRRKLKSRLKAFKEEQRKRYE